jgi:hypothetical protein
LLLQKTAGEAPAVPGSQTYRTDQGNSDELLDELLRRQGWSWSQSHRTDQGNSDR